MVKETLISTSSNTQSGIGIDKWKIYIELTVNVGIFKLKYTR